MDLLPGNWVIQWDYVQKHVEVWGASIKLDVAAHYMSALLPSDDTPVIGVDGWLDPQARVQIMHGQHCKLVLESVLASHVKHLREYVESGPSSSQGTVIRVEPLSQELTTMVHQSKDAWWTVNLYGKGKFCISKYILESNRTPLCT